MKSATENAAFSESYVVEIDGKIESVHRIYIEALKAGMELKQKFAHSRIKVHDAAEGREQVLRLVICGSSRVSVVAGVRRFLAFVKIEGILEFADFLGANG
jgi:hypothetical protein